MLHSQSVAITMSSSSPPGGGRPMHAVDGGRISYTDRSTNRGMNGEQTALKMIPTFLCGRVVLYPASGDTPRRISLTFLAESINADASQEPCASEKGQL